MPAITLIEAHGLADEVLERRRKGETQQQIADFVSKAIGRPLDRSNISRFLRSTRAAQLTVKTFAKAIKGTDDKTAALYLRHHMAVVEALFTIGTDDCLDANTRVRALKVAAEAIPEGFELVAESIEMTHTITDGE